MILSLYARSGEERMQLIPSASDRCTQRLMGESILALSYSHEHFVPLQVGDYLDYLGERYYLLQAYAPEKVSSIEYRYSLRLTTSVGFLNHAKVIKPDSQEAELSFALDARPHEHIRLIVENANRITESQDWRVGTIIQGENRNIDYRNKSCLEALAEIAKAYDTEWWVEGRTINLCRCEHGTAIPLGYAEGLASGIARLPNTTAKPCTRLFPIGSRRNIIPSDYGHSRLRLPQGHNYLERNTHLGIFEESAEEPFAHIYPRYTGTISRVRHEERQGEDGKPYPIYFIQDEALPFNPDEQMIAGQVIHLSFQSGELAGRDFEVNYHAKGKEWEIIAQRPYENQILPSGRLIPAVGDRYIPYNMKMPAAYIERAERELQEAAQSYLERISEDTSVYKAHTDYIHLHEAGIRLVLGQRVLLQDTQLFAHTSGQHPSRITSISRSVLLPTDMDLEMAHAIDIGRVAALEGGVQDLRAAYQEARATLPTILKTWDSADPSDYNVLSALRTLIAIERTALRKDKDDYTEHSIGSRGAIPGIGGWLIKPNGDAYLRNLKIAGALEVDELRKNRITILEGEHYFSSGTAIVKEVNTEEGYFIDTLEAGDATSLQVGYYCLGKWVGTSGAVEVVRLMVTRLSGERIYYSLAPESATHPRSGMHIAQVGHSTDPRRQRATLVRHNVIIQYAGLSGWDVEPRHITGLYGDLEGFVLPSFGALRGSGLLTTNAYISGQLVLQSTDGTSRTPLGYDKGLWRNGSVAYPHDKFVYQDKVWMWMGSSSTTSEPSTRNQGWVDMGITAEEAGRASAAREVARLHGGLSAELRALIEQAEGRSHSTSRTESLKRHREVVGIERDRLYEVYRKLRTDKRLPREKGLSLEQHWINVNGVHQEFARACAEAISNPSDGNIALVERTTQDFKSKVIALQQSIQEAEGAIREELYNAARGKTRTKVALKSLDPNKYYPLIIKLKQPAEEITTYGIRVERPLYNKDLGVPAYASHSNGYSLLLEWSVQASGWGAQAENRRIYTYQRKFLREGERIISAPRQEIRASWEYLYVRGGSDLWVEVTGATDIDIAVYPEGAEWRGGSSSYRWDVLESLERHPEPQIDLDALSDKLIAEIAGQRTALQDAIASAKSATTAEYEARTQQVLAQVSALDGLVRDNVATLQRQIDKQVERFFGSDIARSGVPPTNLWERSEDAKHEGDTYTCVAPKGITIDGSNAHLYPNVGKSWRWTNGGSGNLYGWELIADTDITQALALASKAQATADGKMTNFIGSTPPVGYKQGDQWTLTEAWQGRKGGRAYTYARGSILTATADYVSGEYNPQHWAELVRYTDDGKLNEITRHLQTQIDEAGRAIQTAQRVAEEAKRQADQSVADAIANDGKIDEAESRSIARAVDAYRKGLLTEWERLRSAYTTLKESDYLITKQSLINAYNRAKVRYDSLTAKISAILSDERVSQDEYTAYTETYTAYQSAVQALAQALDTAGKAIQAELARRSADAKTQAQAADSKAEEAGRKAEEAKVDAETARRAAAGLEYLRSALKDGSTTIEGGLTIGNIIAIKDDGGNVTGYLNGLANHPRDPLFALGVQNAFRGNQSELLAFLADGSLWIGDIGLRGTGETSELIIAEGGTRDFAKATVRFGGVQPSYNDFIQSTKEVQTAKFSAKQDFFDTNLITVRSPQYGERILYTGRVFNNRVGVGDRGSLYLRPTGRVRVTGRISLVYSCRIHNHRDEIIEDTRSVVFSVNVTFGGRAYTIYSQYGISGNSGSDQNVEIDTVLRGIAVEQQEHPGIEVVAHYLGNHEDVKEIKVKTILSLETNLTLQYQDYDPDFKEVSIGSFGVILNKGYQNYVAMLSGRDVPIIAAQGDIDLPNTTLYCATFDPNEVGYTWGTTKYATILQASGWYAPKGKELCLIREPGLYFIAHTIGHTDYNVQLSLESDDFYGFISYKNKGAAGFWVYIKDAQGRPKHCPFSIACTGRNYDKEK